MSAYTYMSMYVKLKSKYIDDKRKELNFHTISREIEWKENINDGLLEIGSYTSHAFIALQPAFYC